MWQDISVEEAKKQVIKVTKSFKSEEECLEYWNDLLNQQMDFSRPLWEFHLCENYTKDTSIVFVKMHHALSDGVGFVCLMSLLNDDQFKVKSNKNIKPPTFLQSILLYLLSPFYGLFLMYNFMKTRTDKSAAKMRELIGEDDHLNKFYISELVPFQSIRKCYKRYKNTSFNDYGIAMISKSLNEWYKKHGIEDAKSVQTLIPVNMRDLPKNLDELKFENYTMGIKAQIGIHASVEQALQKTVPEVKSSLNVTALMWLQKITKVFEYLPEKISRIILSPFMENIIFAFTNVPFPKEPWYMFNKKILKVGVFANNQVDSWLVLVAVTYRDNLRFMLASKNKLKMDAKAFLDILMDNINQDINTQAKQD